MFVKFVGVGVGRGRWAWAWVCKTAIEAWVAFFIFFVSFDAVTVGKVKNGFYSRTILQNRF